MEDYLVRATAGAGAVRAVAAVTKVLTEEARQRHDCYPTVTAALGRTMTGAAFIGTALKDEGLVTVKIGGDGPIGGIVAQADRAGHVRGYPLVPQIDLPLTPGGKLDVGGAVGRNGHIYVTYDLKLKEPYTGVAELVSGEIAEDFAYYFTRSDQIPTAVALGVKVDPDGKVRTAGGFMVQLLPGAGEDAIACIDHNIRELAAVTSLLESGLNPEAILHRILAGYEPKILSTMPLSFQCRCSREGVAVMLQSLGQDELRDILATEGQAEVRCHFCNQLHHFDREALCGLLEA